MWASKFPSIDAVMCRTREKLKGLIWASKLRFYPWEEPGFSYIILFAVCTQSTNENSYKFHCIYNVCMYGCTFKTNNYTFEWEKSSKTAISWFEWLFSSKRTKYHHRHPYCRKIYHFYYILWNFEPKKKGSFRDFDFWRKNAFLAFLRMRVIHTAKRVFPSDSTGNFRSPMAFQKFFSANFID